MGQRAKPAKHRTKPGVVRKAPNGGVSQLRDLEKRLAEALEQQTATAEILGIIRGSPADAQPVFDAIAVNALRLCDAKAAVVVRYDGELLHVVAHHNVSPEAIDRMKRQYPLTPVRHLPMGRAVLDGVVVQVPDLQATEEFSGSVARQFGARGHVSIPLLHRGRAIGAIGISRPALGPFSDQQVALLKAFADQAVIAIENARLFNETREALERQTATSEILRVISSWPTDIQPAFDIIAANAARLCNARDAQVLRVEGDALRLVSAYGSPSMPPVRTMSRGHAVGRAVIDRQTIHVRNMAQAMLEFPETSAPQHGVESVLAVPLLRNDVAVGVIRVSRTQVQPFTEAQIALLQTFADQAVIAIENVRLFKELEEKNRALSEAHARVTETLEQQTATSEVLRVISSSLTDVNPVFRTILANANRLCDASFSVLWLWDGEAPTAVAHENVSPAMAEALRAARPLPNRRSPLGLSILEQTIVHVADVLTDPRFTPEDVPSYRLERARSILCVPMVREGSLVGLINIWRREPRAFTDGQIALLQTFADQAVIAIENVRLFKELETRTTDLTRSVDQLTALGEVGRAVSSTLDLGTVLTTIVSRAVQLSGLDGGVVFEYDESAEEFIHRAQTGTGGSAAAARRGTRFLRGDGLIGRTAITLEPIQVSDITVPGAYVGPNRESLIESGIRAILAVPMVRENRLIGCLGVSRNRPGEFPAETIELLRTFATQSALAIQNARLFHEIEVKSRQLELASRHKSEFLANMSHELRTPLNAVIGFSEVLSDRMFGELNEKQDEYLKDIHASGQHLLALINDILDLSKIEAGRMELELSDFDLHATLDSALTLVRERAGRRGITLRMSADPRVGRIRADERKIRQVVLNLLSNAIKFTPEGGRIEVRAAPAGGEVEVAVTDTGVGIAPEDQEAIFEEFRQVGTADRKVEGTGLGLALSRKFVELHGGRIRVESRPGAGSTFTFTIPVLTGA